MQLLFACASSMTHCDLASFGIAWERTKEEEREKRERHTSASCVLCIEEHNTFVFVCEISSSNFKFTKKREVQEIAMRSSRAIEFDRCSMFYFGDKYGAGLEVFYSSTKKKIIRFHPSPKISWKAYFAVKHIHRNNVWLFIITIIFIPVILLSLIVTVPVAAGKDVLTININLSPSPKINQVFNNALVIYESKWTLLACSNY